MDKSLSLISLILLLATLNLSTCSLLDNKNSNNTLRVLHYNIFELDTEKLKEIDLGNKIPEQLSSLKSLVQPYDFHLLSINELQYDLQGVPYPTFLTQGMNLSNFTHWLRPDKGWDGHFVEANTGKDAKRISPQSFATSKDEGARFYADPNNYGLFPGQYSTGLSSRYPIKERISIKDLPWNRFNPKISLAKYRGGQKEKLPSDLSLFDKAFMDTVIEVNHKLIHIITFHTVPAFHFGNKNSPNYQRNRDQLRFLEWYLTGKSDIATKESYNGIKHLDKDDIYIAMGDWNTDITQKNPGSEVLKRLAKTKRFFPEHSITWEASGYNPNRMSMRLDYIFYSEHLRLHKAQVIRPEEKRLLLGCGKNSLPMKKNDPTRALVNYVNKQGQTCRVSIDSEFKAAKEASDHFPIYAEFKFN